MKNCRSKYAHMKVLSVLLLTTMAVFITGNVAFSQDKPETQKVNSSEVWTLQADSYAATLDLKKSKVKKLTKAYIAFREDAKKEENEVSAGEVFNQELNSILESGQAAQGSLILGSMNSRWDTYLKILMGYNLSEEAMKGSSDLVCKYMVQYLEARAEAEKSNARFSSVTSKTLKGELDNGLSEILTKEQKSDWDMQTARKKKTNK